MKGLEPLMLGLKPKVLPIKLHSYITYNIFYYLYYYLL